MYPEYHDILRVLDREGIAANSRYGTMKELVAQQVRFIPGEMVSRTGVNQALGFMELLQILAGEFDLDHIKRVAPRANHELFTLEMAYGPRTSKQMFDTVRTLTFNPESRQAVVFVGTPEDGQTNAQPCTTAIHFLVRHGSLLTNVTMRSWDAVKGLSYDVMCFGGMALAMARCLHLVPGLVTVTAGSLHLYDDDLGKMPLLVNRSFSFDDSVPDDWLGIVRWARQEYLVMDKKPRGVMVTTR